MSSSNHRLPRFYPASSRMHLALVYLVSVRLVGLLFSSHLTAQQTPTRLSFQIKDEAGQFVPCRIHLKNSRGEPVQAADKPFWRDHFVCSGEALIELTAGEYRYEIERGPEHVRQTGVIEVAAEQTQVVRASLNRIAHLRDEGWYCGDLHVHRPVAQIEILMQAEDLDFAPVITWWNQRNPWRNKPVPSQTQFTFDGHRQYTNMAGEDEREGGALLYFGLPRPLDLFGSVREFPSPLFFVQQAHQAKADVWIDIEKPFWWDVPTWLASGQMDSIGIANNHMCHSQMYLDEAWGKPRDLTRLPNPRGNGFWTQEIYYHILNTGLRIPPSAGSASGVLPNPVGYNRVYVYLGDHQPAAHRTPLFSPQSWFDGLSQGKCFVTNGPLLRVRANGHTPGTTLMLTGDSGLSIELQIDLVSRDRISELEVIYNGQVVSRLPCTSSVQQKLDHKIQVTEPGWFLVRGITDVQDTFRFASTAPWYIESDARRHRISRLSCQLFRDWVNGRIQRVRQNVSDGDQLQAILGPHLKAQEYWSQRMASANAELTLTTSPIPSTSSPPPPRK